MYKVLNKQIEYPLSGSFSGSINGTASYALNVPSQSFDSLIGKPTTINGYGITDAASLIHTHSINDITNLSNSLDLKQNIISTGSINQYYRGNFSLATFPTGISSFNNDVNFITSSSLSTYVPYTGAIGNVDIGSNQYLGGRLQIGIPTQNTPANFAVAIKNSTLDGLYLEGTNNTTRILLQAQGLTGGNGQVEFLAGMNNNSYLRLGSSYLRESSGFLAIGGSNFTPTATLHVRGASSVTGHAFIIQNSAPTTLFSVSNTGLTTFNPLVSSGDAIEITNNGYIKQSSIRFRGSGATLQVYDSSFNMIFSSGPTLTTIRGVITQGGNTSTNANLMLGFGASYFSMANTYTSLLGGFIHGFDIKNNHSPAAGSTGIFRDIYIAPTLGPNIQDWRAIEVIGGSASTSTLIKLNNGVIDVFCVKGDNKIGIFGAAPIAKATTSYPYATLSSPGGGTNIKTDDTFNGYTISQVINYLKDIGLLT